MKSIMVKARNELPPYEKNGRGIPIMGNNPIVIIILMIKCNRIIKVTE